MAQAIFSVTSVEIQAGSYLFKTSGTKTVFDGFSVLYPAVESQKDGEKRKVPWSIPVLTVGETLNLLKLVPSQHFTKPPARYSDATLVKTLEEKGIGRPSTYAPIIQTIILRNYVKRMRGYLQPTELGEITNSLLVKHFPNVLDTGFTASMEDKLDGIEEGTIDWLVVLKSFYS